jgi:beta-glucosidase
MVAGPGAESIPMQCGGWSLTWQGSDTSNADFPGATSIKDAIRSAIEAAGGRLVDGDDLAGKDRPDVAVIVYGEQPYAEMFGDVQLALYNTGQPLEQLRQLRQAGIATVSVLLSGRPLWARPEIELSDAFVAAWLPGTEGAGIADLLIGDAAGKPRFDFRGRLSFAWPNAAAPVAGHSRAASADTWPIGYGMSYAPAPP